MSVQRTIEMAYDLYGKIVEQPNSLSQLIQKGFCETGGEVQGDGAAVGTLLYSKEVPAGSVLAVNGIIISTMVAASLIQIVNSDLAVLAGATEIDLVTFDIGAVATVIIDTKEVQPIIIDNKAGAASRFLNIYAPQSRAGAATNNANTQYWSANVKGIIES